MKPNLKKGASFLISCGLSLSAIGLPLPAFAEEKKTDLDLSFICDENNDLYKTAMDNYAGIDHYESLSEAVQKAEPDSGIAVLADGYPDTLTTLELDDKELKQVESKKLRLYVEYPENNAQLGLEYEGTGDMGFDRLVVLRPDEMDMPDQSLLYAQGARFVKKAKNDNTWIANAKVVGYDTARLGLDGTNPFSLLEVNGNVMAASTKLSQFVSARYAPYGRWQKLWSSVFTWLTSSETRVPEMSWQMRVHAAYSKNESLPSDAYVQAIANNAEWYQKSGMLLSDADAANYWNVATYGGIEYKLNPGGDGSNGVLENFASGRFNTDGSQRVRVCRRADCNGESAGALAMAYLATGNQEYASWARNIMDWMLTDSDLALGNRADPESPEYGLLAWDDCTGSKYNYYGDDNAKAILGMISAASALNETKWDKRILECITANFRTTGVDGFRSGMISGSSLESQGWETYFLSGRTNYSAHFEALPWATYLWAYSKTGYEPFLERTKNAIGLMMEAYDNGQWLWTNGIQQERAKMILPLAWLCRIEDTEEHQAWLDRIVSDLIYYQKDHGGIQDQMGAGTGQAGGFSSNAEYGTHEAPVIDTNEDPCVDNLYTESFALMALNDAAYSTSNTALANKCGTAARKLAEFLVRIQQVSDDPEADGVWYRGFDYDKWETYGSDGDTDWGIWSTETGWTQAWITNTLSMMTLDSCIWDLTAGTELKEIFPEMEKSMLTVKGLDNIKFEPMLQTWGTGGFESLTDGVYGTLDTDVHGRVFANGTWSGLEGKDVTITLDLTEVREFDQVSLGFLNEYRMGVRYPKSMEVQISMDGESFETLETFELNEAFTNEAPSIKRLETRKSPTSARYVKFIIKNGGLIPEGHGSAGSPTWIFMDEITIHYLTEKLEDVLPGLEKLITQAKKVESSVHSPESMKQLKEALAEAEAVMADEKKTVDSVKQASAKLEAALNALEPYATVTAKEGFKNGRALESMSDNIYGVSKDFNHASYGSYQNEQCDNAEFIIDLGTKQPVTSVGFAALSNPGVGIYLPIADIAVADTSNGEWTPVAHIDSLDYDGLYQYSEPTQKNKFLSGQEHYIRLADCNAEGRYVKITLNRFDKGAEWMFLDELFVNRSYIISVNSPDHGTAELSAVSAKPGESVILTLKPDEGSELDHVTVNGKDVTNQVKDGQLTVSNIKTDHSIHVTFTKPAANKEALQKLVDSCDALNEADYTSESWQVLTEALAKANEVLTDENVDQNTVDNAAATLKAAIESLAEKPKADKSALQKLAEECGTLVESEYTQESWKAMTDALQAANEVLADGKAQQADVDKAAAALQIAIDSLQRKPVVNKSALESMINLAGSLEESGWTAESWTALQEALSSARKVMENEKASQDEVNTAEADLRTAYDNLVEAEPDIPVDKTMLEELLIGSRDLDAEKYTSASWKTFEEERTKAETVYNDSEATQTMVNEAAANLSQALHSLVLKANTQALENTLKDISGLNAEDYTAESWNMLLEARGRAEALLKSEPADQEEVDAVMQEILNAVQALVIRVDKSGLKKALDQAESLNEKDYTPDSWNALCAAVEHAKAVFENENASQTDIDAAEKKLLAAISSLTEPSKTDTSALEQVLAEIDGLKEDEYTSESWKALMDVRKEAEAVLTAEKTDQKAVDTVHSKLLETMKNLEKKSSDKETPDLSKLQEAVDRNDTIREDGYTAESWKTYQETLTEARELLNKMDASQSEVDAMTEKLLSAEKALVPAAADPSNAPRIIKGDRSVWEKGSKADLEIVSDAPFDKFQKVLVDGKELAKENYEAQEGSTIILLKADYLQSLSNGQHKLEIVSANGTAETTFTISPATGNGGTGTNPGSGGSNKNDKGTSSGSKTAAETGVWTWFGLMTAAFAGFAGVLAVRKRQKNS